MRFTGPTGPTGPERTDMSEENQRMMDMLSDPLRNPMMSGRVENTFGPLDYVLGTFPAHRFIAPAAQKVVKMLGLDDLALPSFGFGKVRPGPSEAAVAGAEPVIQQADQILNKRILDAMAKRGFLKKRPNMEKLPPSELFDDIVDLVGDDLGGKAYYRAIREANNPAFKELVLNLQRKVVDKLTQKLGREPFTNKKYLGRDLDIADEMLDQMIVPYFQGVLSKPPKFNSSVPGLNYMRSQMTNPDSPFYAPYKLNANGGRIAVDPTGPEELTFPQEMFIRGMHMESGFNPKAVSPRGAQGIAQIMPSTVAEFRRLGIIGKDEPFDPFDVNDARRGQEAYMNYLITRNEGTDQVRLAKAVAAYNYGQTNLNRYLAKQVKKGVDTMNTLDWVDELPGETRNYVNALMFAEFPERKKNYEQQRGLYFERYPDVQDERQATPREDVAPMESKDPSPQISPELQEALDILVRDQKKYEHGGRHGEGPTGAEIPNYRTDSFNAPVDSDPSYLNEKIERARKTGTGLKTRARPQGEDQNPFEYTELNPVYTMTDPSAVKTANEYYKAAYSDPSVIEILNNFFDQSGPNRTSPSNSAGNRDDFPQQIENLRALYPNATDATLGDLLARRSRDIMSSTSDFVLLEDRSADWGSVTDQFSGDGTKGGTDAGSRDNPIWMGLGDVQRRGGRKVQIDLLPESGDRQSVTTHEMSHAQDRSGRYIPPAMVDYMTNLRLDRSEAKINDGEAMTKRRYDYLSQPTETRARLQDLRQKVFDLRGGEFSREVDRETFDKLKSEMAYKDLVGLYGEEGVFDLINNVYEHGGSHDDPPNYSLGQQVLDYLDSYGVPGGRGDANNRFESTLQDLADSYLGRQGAELGTDPQKKYDLRVGDFVDLPSESELFPIELDRVFVTNDPKEKRRYTLGENFDDRDGFRSSVSVMNYDPVTERYLSSWEERDLKKEGSEEADEILDRLVTTPLVYNYPSSNPSARANAEEFYHAVQKVSDKARGIRGKGFMGNSEDVRELVDMGYNVRGGGILYGEYNPIDDLVNLYQAQEGFGPDSTKSFYEGVSPDNAGIIGRIGPARYYFGKDNKMEADAALQVAVYQAKKMGILPEGPITEEDIPQVLERLQGYTATQGGKSEFDPEKLRGWKPDGRKIAKIGKDGEVTLTKYGQKWMQDDENKLRFKERTMSQGEGKEARLDTEYTRILEGLLYDVVNERGLFDPTIGNLENIRSEYNRVRDLVDKDQYAYTDPDSPWNQPGSGKTPIELLLNIINTGGGLGSRYGERSRRSEEYLEGEGNN